MKHWPWAILALFSLTGCGGDAAVEPEPEPEPANVVINSVGEVQNAPSGWDVSLVVENTGGDGKFNVRFETEGCSSGPLAGTTIGAGATLDRVWLSSCQLYPEEVVTLTLLEGEFVETDRASIPQQ